MPILILVATSCAAMLGVSSAALSLLAHGGRVSTRLDILTHFAPIYLAMALVALPLCFAATRELRLGLALCAVAGLVASGALLFPEYLPEGRAGSPAEGGQRLKVVQFNAWGGNATPEAAAAWIFAQDPDVVVLQEGAEVAAALAATGKLHGTCVDCPVAILTRGKPLSSASGVPIGRDFSYLLAVNVASERGAFTVVGAHCFWPVFRTLSKAQAADLRRLVARYPRERMIIAGDFNSTPWSFARRRDDRDFGLIRRTRALFTWPAEKISHNRLPAPFPYLPIDHVYAGPGWATVSVERGPRLGSDHYPVVVTLAPREVPAR